MISLRKAYEEKITEIALGIEHLMELTGITREEILENTDIPVEKLNALLDADIEGGDIELDVIAKLEVYLDEDILLIPYKKDDRPMRRRTKRKK